MRVVATTVVRESIRGKQRTGTIYDVDWEAGSVRTSFPVPDPVYPETDSNPRGGMRGGRGITAVGETIVTANYDSLLVYDDTWKLLDSFTHPLFAGLHELDSDGEFLYVAATAIDAVLRVHLESRTVETAWDPHRSPLAGRFGITVGRTGSLDGSVDYRRRASRRIDQCHLNGVVCLDDGLVVNCGLVRPTRPWHERQWRRVTAKLGQAETAAARPRGCGVTVHVPAIGVEQVLAELPERDMPTHNGQPVGAGRIAVNDSTDDTLRIFAGAAGGEQWSLRVSGTWLRGLEPIDHGRVLVGTAPASIVMLDLERREEFRRVQLSENQFEAIHGLAVVPE